jgi:hypothetical protein
LLTVIQKPISPSTPSTKLTDPELENDTLIVTHVNSFKMGDKLARFDAFIPWQNSEWDGSLNGESKNREQAGFADPVNTVVGTAISVSLPFGSYNDGPTPRINPFRAGSPGEK